MAMRAFGIRIGIVTLLWIACEITGRIAVHFDAAGALLGGGRSAGALIAMAWMLLRISCAIATCGLCAWLAMRGFDAIVKRLEKLRDSPPEQKLSR
jgi:hypothetical protein